MPKAYRRAYRRKPRTQNLTETEVLEKHEKHILWILEAAKLIDGGLTFDHGTLQVASYETRAAADKAWAKWKKKPIPSDGYQMLCAYSRGKRWFADIRAAEPVMGRLFRRFQRV